ncbi:hypothetical protein OESDEN_22715 [Oesophagostomum dentatum]|uniref:Uncharacterized protein n=1 Tax=Oesophagostomum dentatum TaxID=61180 RepID=A0A0B1S3A8_OESDE|nr:hypothetical protein OESDEN_22715 [Oesophagostomum dentatum]
MSKASCGALEYFRVTRVPSFLTFHKALKSAGAVFIGTSDAVAARKIRKNPQLNSVKWKWEAIKNLLLSLIEAYICAAHW